jgi:hypothetical protein
MNEELRDFIQESLQEDIQNYDATGEIIVNWLTLVYFMLHSIIQDVKFIRGENRGVIPQSFKNDVHSIFDDIVTMESTNVSLVKSKLMRLRAKYNLPSDVEESTQEDLGEGIGTLFADPKGRQMMFNLAVNLLKALPILAAGIGGFIKIFGIISKNIERTNARKKIAKANNQMHILFGDVVQPEFRKVVSSVVNGDTRDALTLKRKMLNIVDTIVNREPGLEPYVSTWGLNIRVNTF